MQLDQITAEDFESLAGTTLALDSGRARVDCELVEVRRLPTHGLRAEAPFAILLRGPRTPVLPQGICNLRHPVHGTLSLFVVPIGADAAGMRYEITFN